MTSHIYNMVRRFVGGAAGAAALVVLALACGNGQATPAELTPAPASLATASAQDLTAVPAQPTASAAATRSPVPSTASPATPAQTAASTCSGVPTPASTEGPYYTAGSPLRTSLLEHGQAGTRLVLTGRVFDRSCKPVAGAWLDFWQTDANGDYDNSGYGMRGQQFADLTGGYRLETVVPGEYPGRTLHIHFKVSAPGGPVLTSQVYFPGAAGNARDAIYSQALLVRVVSEDAGGMVAVLDFVLR